MLLELSVWWRSYWNVDLRLKLSPLYSKTFSQIILGDSSQLSTLIVSTHSLDAGAIQLDPLQMDITQTLKTYFENIHLNYSVLLDQEVQFLSDRRPVIVLVGATPIACKKCNIVSARESIYCAMLESSVVIQEASLGTNKMKLSPCAPKIIAMPSIISNYQG